MAKDTTGFISNRILIPLFSQAVRMLEPGFSSAGDIDLLHTLSFGHSMGPLALLDLSLV